ncbi:MAG: bifunctional precorrin-2 dehydrogenase/sirohydrochlorin ferrochelatase, partial [Candidatus Omnitrophica bacterium]|nr:bifunctional precorrin-2 dehydrogenase/sirohydrochlorin ferrochelatase [Candidatus Omnitrophota bacterium]
VVIGGGLVAQRKVTTLLRYGADITLVSPEATTRLRSYARKGAIRYRARRFRPSDLKGCWLVYAATDEQRINEQVYRQATRRRIFTNVVDQKPLCSFIAPAICRRGDLVIAVSTGGGSPTIAKRLRRELQQEVGPEYARMIRLLKGLRSAAKRRMPSYRDRKRYFDGLVQGRVFELVRAGRSAAARREALALLPNGSR